MKHGLKHFNIKKISIKQIFVEELGKDFGDLNIPEEQIDYLNKLIDLFENEKSDVQKIVCLQELRMFLRHLKKMQIFYDFYKK
jgi:hypothetical protein